MESESSDTQLLPGEVESVAGINVGDEGHRCCSGYKVETRNPWFRRRWLLIEPVQFLYYFYFSGSMPVVGQFVKYQIQARYKNAGVSNDTGQVCSDYNNGSFNTLESIIEAEASRTLMYMNIAAIVPAFFSTIFFGGYSDTNGRRLVLVLPLTGAALRLGTLIITLALDLGVFFLVLSSLLDGICGMSCMLLMGCFSYVSDITNYRQRTFRTVLLEVFAGVGIICSHLVTGYLISTLGFMWTFVVLLAIILVNLCYVVFILEESLMLDEMNEGTPFWSLKSFVRAFRIYTADDGTGRRFNLLVALFLVMLVSFVQLGHVDVQTLFMMNYPLCFQSMWIGYFNTVFYACTNATNLIVTKLFGSTIGDVGLIFVGCLFGIGYALMFGLSRNKTMLFLAALTGCGCLLPIPLLRSFSSKIVRPDEIGSMFASIAWIQMIGILIGGVSQNAIFSASVAWMPSLVFIFDAGIYLLIAGIVLIFLCCIHHQTQYQPLNTAQQQHDTAQQQYDTAQQQHDTAQQQHDTAQKQHDTAQQQYDTAQQQHDTAQQHLDTADLQHNPQHQQHELAHERQSTDNIA